MPKNRTLQRLRRRLVYWGARVAQAILLVLPFDMATAVGGWLGRLAFTLLRSERRRTLKHLALAFGQDKQEHERREIARRVFVNAGRSIAEMMLFPRWNDKRLRQRIRFDEPEPLLRACRSGRGFVFLTAHFGNWELLGAFVVQVLGVDLGVIARRLSNPYLDRLVNDYRRRAGMKVFLRGERAASFSRHLRQGGTLGILGDHDIRGLKGVFVDFFGRPPHTPTGPAELILHSGVPWFTILLERSRDGYSHRVHCEGPFPIPDGENRAAKALQLTEQYMQWLERIVRRHPDQWMWMHDRWRKKPKT